MTVVASIAVVVIVLGALLFARARRPAPTPTPVAEGQGPEVVGGGGLLVLAVQGEATLALARGTPGPATPGQTFPAPALLRTGQQARLSVSLAVRQNKLTLGPSSSLTIHSVAPGRAPGAHVIEIGELAGVAMVNLSFGDPKVSVALAEGTLTLGRSVARVEVGDRPHSIKVAWGRATLTRGGTTTAVRGGQKLEWEPGGDPGEPVPLDMIREVWR